MEDIITKKEFLKRYNISRKTFNNWIKTRELPVIEVSSHSKFIKRSDLVEWENRNKR